VSSPDRVLDPEDSSVRLTDINSLPVGTRAAVSYLRVSTKEQAAGGGLDQGFSIPAQRLANHRKAGSMGAAIVAEFVDAGESARKADRPQLQAMLNYVAVNKVSYCIVHKVDRLARNRVDDVEINVALTRAGVQLVSASENIDETPSGMLLHGIMSTIAEFYSRNLATEVTKGLTQKAMSGGTVARAPIGYKNVRRFDALGREFRTVEVDDERVPLVQWAFETYATGDWSLSMLQAELAIRGLRTRPTPKIAAKPLEIANLHKMLRNPYYVGDVIYRGTRYDGSHEQIIDKSVWERVQSVLTAHNNAGDRQRTHEHYLKGSIFCGSCGSRLMVTMATNPQGATYDYFVCLGRHTKRTNCMRPAMRIDHVEAAVERAWVKLRLSQQERTQAQQQITEKFEAIAKEDGRDHQHLNAERDLLTAERGKLLAAHYADAIPLDLLKIEQDRISVSLAIIDEQLSTVSVDASQIKHHLDSILQLLQHCSVAYRDAKPQLRRLLNQAFATAIYIDEDGSARFVLNETVGAIRMIAAPASAPAIAPSAVALMLVEDPPPTSQHLVPSNRNPRKYFPAGISISATSPYLSKRSLNKPLWVDPRRFELLTSSMRTRRATNCAKGPFAA
jgi:site-specific DNA recombinase